MAKTTISRHVCDQGDSGGPFTVKNSGTNKHDLVGVVSWGDGCAAVGMVIMMLVIMMLVIMLLVIMILVIIVHVVGGD